MTNNKSFTRHSLGVLGVPVYGLALLAVQRFQFNVVNYRTFRFEQVGYWPARIFGLLVLLGIIVLAGRACRLSALGVRWRTAGSMLWPLLLGAPLAWHVFVDSVPPFALTFLMILGAGWAALRTATANVECQMSNSELRMEKARPSHSLIPVGSIILLIALLTVVHTRIQLNFFEHFMLGHSDIGHFTEELKNALAGRGLRSDSFDNTRLGWHFVPLLYVLAPGYALWPSPVYLMVCGAAVVHLPALPVYYVARRLSGSTAIGLIWAVAWLLLPSQSRLIYANTYGFPWNNVTMPVLALMIAAGVTHRWRTSLVLGAVLLLCRETAAAAVLGWGLYVALFTPRRKTGVLIAAVSVAYFMLCVNVLIPHFSEAGRYERFDMFGELGGTLGDLLGAAFLHPGILFERLCRREVFYSMCMFLVPMALLPLWGWRMTTAALPMFLSTALLQNAQWLSIKFWHQATVLPFLFFAAVISMKPDRDLHAARTSARAKARARGGLAWLTGRRNAPCRAVNFGIAAGALVCSALGHYFYGFSPISKAYEVHASTPFLQQPDPRLDTVHRLRARIPKDRTILATERMAAHFTDYKRLYTGRRIRPVDYVVIDRSDAWDTSGLPQDVSRFAEDARCRVYGEFGSIIVFECRPDAPPVPPEI
jgi:uncharacterized membrane protein